MKQVHDLLFQIYRIEVRFPFILLCFTGKVCPDRTAWGLDYKQPPSERSRAVEPAFSNGEFFICWISFSIGYFLFVCLPGVSDR